LRKPTVDYSGFRLSRLNEPKFRHLWLLISWPFYFITYFGAEHLYPIEKCIPMHCFLDDVIPFNEFFVIPYTGWYFLLAFTVFYFMFYDKEQFKRFHIMLIITEIIAITIYVIFPTRVDFQPTEFERNNVFTWIMDMLYAVDRNTNANPSLHVAVSILIGSAFSKHAQTKLWQKIALWIFIALVCLSTAFTKQHSVLDFFGALPVCLIAEIAAYGKSYWLPKFKRSTAKV